MISHLFLDFDNTMMATEHLSVPSIVARFNELYATQIAHPLTVDEFQENFHGQARESLCADLEKFFGISIDFKEMYKDREWRMMQLIQKSGVDMAEGLVDALGLVKTTSGCQLVFVSNNPVQRALASMRYATNGQGPELAALFGTAFFEAGDTQKPRPDVYLRAMEQMEASAAFSAAVEDSVSGLRAALGAGLKTYGFLGFAQDKESQRAKLMSEGATACFSSWSEFPALLGLESNADCKVYV